jgi:DNA helicase-2/ATP-dependent DNA helicase PcrA
MNVTALKQLFEMPVAVLFSKPRPGAFRENRKQQNLVLPCTMRSRRLFEKMQQTERFPEKQEFILDFEWHMKRHRESFTKEQFARRRMEYGHEVLNNYYDTIQ